MEPLQETAVDPRTRIGEALQGKWRLVSLLGIGSTAAVFRATGAQGEPVAVKVLHLEYSRDETLRTRFAREAYVANLIAHPGVVHLIADGETADGAPFLVMELLDGETLEARWERKGRKLPVPEVLWYADKILDVLATAHAQGVVHRDIKPENVFLTNARVVKLLDFGIARLREAASNVEPMTRAGSLMGTLAFMPPEQARGETDAVGVQTDLWAVGATMFTLLTGQLVHEGEEFHALLSNATKRAPPSLGAVAKDVPNAVVELVDFALSFDVAKRWANARTMQRAVREVHAIMQQHSQQKQRAASLADPGSESAPVSEPMFEFQAKLPSVDPPPMSRARTTETLPPTSNAPPVLRTERPNGLRETTRHSTRPPPQGTRDGWMLVAAAVALVVVVLVALWSSGHRGP